MNPAVRGVPPTVPMRLVLPGGKASVSDPRSWLRVAVWGAWLFGPMYVTALAAARTGRGGNIERRWAHQAVRAARIDIEATGLHHIEPGAPYVVAPLHEGFADALVLHTLPLDFVWAVRDELFDWRLLGPYLRASGQICVPTHEGRAGYRALLRGARDALAEGKSVVVFPQGSILGIEAAFHPGAFRLADATGASLLPVVMSGTHRVWEHPYHTTLRLDQRVRLQVLAPIPVGRAGSRMRDVEREMKAAALQANPPPRRFDPERDGWWDDYPYEIDPTFVGLADRVRIHRGRTV